MLTAACANAVQPYEAPPTTHLHGAGFASASALESAAPDRPNGDWWLDFNDPALALLVSKGLQNNRDIQAAAYRITAARLGQVVQRRGTLPFLDVNISNTILRGVIDDSDSTASENGIARTLVEGLQINGFLSWEYDLFGRIRNEARIAKTETDISQELGRDVMQVVTNEVVLAYIDFRAAQSQLNLINRIREKRAEGFALLQTATQLGVATKFDETRQRLEDAEVETLATEFTRLRSIALFNLEALIGEKLPADITTSRDGLERLDAPLELPMRSPELVIRQRPDVRIAERQLAAETYQIGQEVTEYYPRLTLFADFEPLSSDPLSLSQLMNFSIRDFRLVGARVGQQRASTRAALANFDAVVLRALEEVEVSLTTLGAADERVRNEAHRLSLSLAARDRMQEMLDAGITTRPQFLVLEIEALEVERELEDAKADRIEAFAQVYRAFGGDFRPGPKDSREEFADSLDWEG